MALQNWKDLHLAEQRVNELLYLWESETEESWTQDWRAELNEMEQELVEGWDESWTKGLFQRKREERI